MTDITGRALIPNKSLNVGVSEVTLSVGLRGEAKLILKTDNEEWLYIRFTEEQRDSLAEEFSAVVQFLQEMKSFRERSDTNG
jgi:hypothetical protein